MPFRIDVIWEGTTSVVRGMKIREGTSLVVPIAERKTRGFLAAEVLVSDRGIQFMTEEATRVELQHINIKLLLEAGFDLDPVIPIFHSWIQEQPFEELLLDVADYRHVHHGSGIVLIGHEADYSLDNTDGRWGIRYNRKAALDGSNEVRLRQATRAALVACQRLEADTRLNRKLLFNGQDVELFINDRALAPNNPDTRDAIGPDISTFADALFGVSEYELVYVSDPRKLFGALIKASEPASTRELLKNLAA